MRAWMKVAKRWKWSKNGVLHLQCLWRIPEKECRREALPQQVPRLRGSHLHRLPQGAWVKFLSGLTCTDLSPILIFWRISREIRTPSTPSASPRTRNILPRAGPRKPAPTRLVKSRKREHASCQCVNKSKRRWRFLWKNFQRQLLLYVRAHCAGRGSRFDFRSQQKFHQNMLDSCQYYLN